MLLVAAMQRSKQISEHQALSVPHLSPIVLCAFFRMSVSTSCVAEASDHYLQRRGDRTLTRHLLVILIFCERGEILATHRTGPPAWGSVLSVGPTLTFLFGTVSIPYTTMPCQAARKA